MGVDLVASDAIVAEDLVVPVSPTEGEEGSTKDTEELALGLLVGDPGHCLRLAVRETHLDVVVGSVADEEVVDLVHQTIMLIIASTQTPYQIWARCRWDGREWRIGGERKWTG